ARDRGRACANAEPAQQGGQRSGRSTRRRLIARWRHSADGAVGSREGAALGGELANRGPASVVTRPFIAMCRGLSRPVRRATTARADIAPVGWEDRGCGWWGAAYG